jgi:hypothetical protein
MADRDCGARRNGARDWRAEPSRSISTRLCSGTRTRRDVHRRADRDAERRGPRVSNPACSSGAPDRLLPATIKPDYRRWDQRFKSAFLQRGVWCEPGSRGPWSHHAIAYSTIASLRPAVPNRGRQKPTHNLRGAFSRAAFLIPSFRSKMGDVHGPKPALESAVYDTIKLASVLVSFMK